MAKNDKILLDGIIEEMIKQKIPSDKKDEVLEFLVFEQILKEFDLSDEEILTGIVDGGGDGGIDGFFIFVNGHLVQDLENFIWPKTNSELQIYLITCKHHDTFKQSTLDSLIASITELFDFTIENIGLKGRYSDLIIQKRDILKSSYIKTSINLNKFNINVFYASRGDYAEKEVIARGEQIKSIIKDLFSDSITNMFFIGSKELVKLYRVNPTYTLELKFNESLTKGKDYIIITSLSDYYNFISDNGKLRRYLFDSNVRDYMGLNPVNDDIKVTLENNDSPDFWLLNNGVTLLATNASLTGKTILIQNIQIVNGLQTTQSIFNYFNSGGQDNNNRSVLIKVIVEKNDILNDLVIRATNNQTSIKLTSLHATEKIQKDIEDIMLKNGFGYERRANFYKNQGFKKDYIISPLYLGAGFASLILKNIGIYFNINTIKDDRYKLIFSDDISIEIRPKITFILKKVDFILIEFVNDSKSTGKFLKKWRYIISFLLISRHYSNFAFTINDLINFDTSNITKDCVSELLLKIDYYKQTGDIINYDSKSLNKLCAIFSKDYGIKGLSIIKKNSRLLKRNKIIEVNEDFISIVKDNLPKQPWKEGMTKNMMQKLDCSYLEYNSAVSKLIERGFFYRQEGGILYDKSGKIIGYDKSRVDGNTLKILDF